MNGTRKTGVNYQIFIRFECFSCYCGNFRNKIKEFSCKSLLSSMTELLSTRIINIVLNLYNWLKKALNIPSWPHFWVMINAISAEFVHRRFSPSLMSALEIKTLIEWRTRQSESHLAIVKRARWALVTTLITRQAVQIHAQRITEVHHRTRHKKARTGFFSVFCTYPVCFV